MAAIEPPPAPISIMSITGVLMGSPEPLVKRCTRAASSMGMISKWPSSISAALAVVPPMSKEITSLWPARRPNQAVARPPPAGPDSSKRIGKAHAVCGDIRPPAECIRRKAPVKPRSVSSRCSFSRYALMSGCTKALAAVVTQRWYSDSSGTTALDKDSASDGNSRAASAATCCSWTGLRYA